jgi:ribonuclease PH
MRIDGREADELRPVKIELEPIAYPEGATLIRMGRTWVLCAVTVEEGVPRWRRGRGAGWLTAQYALLPRSTQTRTRRDHFKGGRAKEISRLIGRSLRQAVDLSLIGERTLTVDCDVLQADGGTRTAAVTGGYVAVALALRDLIEGGAVEREALQPPIAAVSAGVVEGACLLDLNYEEDSRAGVDLNVVMDAQGHYVEIQGTAEREPVPRETVDALLALAASGVESLVEEQREVLAWAGLEI